MTVPRNRVGVGVIDNMIYAVGGSQGQAHHNSAERWAQGAFRRNRHWLQLSFVSCQTTLPLCDIRHYCLCFSFPILPFCLFHPLSHLQIYFLICKMHLSFFLLGSVFTFIPLFLSLSLRWKVVLTLHCWMRNMRERKSSLNNSLRRRVPE